MKKTKEIHEEVQSYYGQQLKTTSDLKTNACCTIQQFPDHIKNTLGLIHDEVLSKYYGCGLTIPDDLKNTNVLDLGSGSGRDCFIASKLVGENGRVVGIDMTDEQLQVAKKHIDYHAETFGYKSSNVEFKKGNIENLEHLDLGQETFDIIISNCVINLASNKEKVLRDANTLLKQGGEMYFSDVYADRRIPQHLKEDPTLYGECLSGALYWNDFLDIAKKSGFTDPRVVDTSPITINNKELEKKIGNIKFYSVTYRLFNIKNLEGDCEDYGQAVVYKGTISESPDSFILDNHHIFEKGKIESVCGNTFLMLSESRFKEHFEFTGNFDTHFGIFEGCGTLAPFDDSSQESKKGNSCC